MKHLASGAAGHADKIEVLLKSLNGQCSKDSDVFIHDVLQGLADIEHGRYISLAETKKRLGLS